jgi:hypothetical protein
MNVAPGIQIRNGLKQLAGDGQPPISVSLFAAHASPPLTQKRLSQQKLNQIVRGLEDFDSPDDAQDFLRVLDGMFYLQDKTGLPINWGAVPELREPLAKAVDALHNQQDPVEVRCLYVRLSRLNFLEGLRSNGSVIETQNYHSNGAAFIDFRLAQECVRRLQKLGVSAQIEPLTYPRRRSTITRSLEQIGFPAIELEQKEIEHDELRTEANS